MCGIAGIINLRADVILGCQHKLQVMNQLLAHRGPDDQGIWIAPKQHVGFAHRRLAVIDLTSAAHQPFVAENGMVIVFNGEIYNYKALRQQLSDSWQFTSQSDTEVILAAYQRYGEDCVNYFEGMFAFCLFDGEKIFCAVDHSGIKPFYYTQVGDLFIFASEAKALLPFLKDLTTDSAAVTEYLVFQYPVSDLTLFKGIKKLPAAHTLSLQRGKMQIKRYWNVHYDIDFAHDDDYFQAQLQECFTTSVQQHLVSDVPLGCYLSGGLDSSLISVLAQRFSGEKISLFTGRFDHGPEYDESRYAKIVAQELGCELNTVTITAADFIRTMPRLIYHLDHPIAGVGAFPQYLVSEQVGQNVKVVLGGQGADELFGGYARYLLAYFEQCIKAAIDGTADAQKYIVTPESIIPQLNVLKAYKPMMQYFWQEGLFDAADKRYLRLIDRSLDMGDSIRWEGLDKSRAYDCFFTIFNSIRQQRDESYFDSMTHFDYKCLLPALLHVEDRVSMAHGVESRVPFVQHKLVELLARTPPAVKFKNGELKRLLRHSFAQDIPQAILQRKDKMGFPVPLNDWLQSDLQSYVFDVFTVGKNRSRDLINYDNVLATFAKNKKFSRKMWGLLNLELWYQQFIDQAAQFRRMLNP